MLPLCGEIKIIITHASVRGCTCTDGYGRRRLRTYVDGRRRKYVDMCLLLMWNCVILRAILQQKSRDATQKSSRAPFVRKGAITSKIKHAIKLKTSPARLAQLLQPS